MSAFVTNQFRIDNASNFIDSVSTGNYFVFLGLSNETEQTPSGSGGNAFGRDVNWNSNTVVNMPPNPVDNLDYLYHYRDTTMFGKKVIAENCRKVVKKIEWKQGGRYDTYRHDYSLSNKTSVTDRSTLFGSNYYVINSEFRVYVCIDNGFRGEYDSSGRPIVDTAVEEPRGNDVAIISSDSDKYKWMYLFTISASDVIKFDSTHYIVLPNNWLSPDAANSIIRVRDRRGSQIQHVVIDNPGSGYTSTTFAIKGDGTGGEVSITVDESGSIIDTVVTSSGSGYTYAYVDLPASATPARLVPIIPPSTNHGADIYKELGADKVLMYARFDSSNTDFISDTTFAQVGIIKNPKTYGEDSLYTQDTFSSTYAVQYTGDAIVDSIVGTQIKQERGSGPSAIVCRGWVVSHDATNRIIRYVHDRSLSYPNGKNQEIGTGDSGVEFNEFEGSTSGATNDFTVGSSETAYSITSTTGPISGISFTNGIATPEINSKTGDIIYIDNRKSIQRDLNQKEDVKIILEF